MDLMVLLMVLSVAGVVALFLALAFYLRAISRELESIGGPATRFYRPVNYLSKIRLGLRAIEVETGHLAPEVVRLNQQLAAIRDGLKVVDQELAGVIDAVGRQKA
jgi:hypothetical protein